MSFLFYPAPIPVSISHVLISSPLNIRLLPFLLILTSLLICAPLTHASTTLAPVLEPIPQISDSPEVPDVASLEADPTVLKDFGTGSSENTTAQQQPPHEGDAESDAFRFVGGLRVVSLVACLTTAVVFVGWT